MSDGHLDQGVREGTTAEVHLRDPLVLDGAVIAPAGTRARLVVGGTTNSANGLRTLTVALERFSINAGLMPVRAKAPIVPPIAPGATIEATTLAEVDHIGDRYSIVVPFPFKLSNDQPASSYTPTPARTAPPQKFPSRNRTPEPATPAPTSAPADPGANGVPAPAPSSTKIPG